MFFLVSPADLNVLFSCSFIHKLKLSYCSMYVVPKNFDQAEYLCKRTLGPWSAWSKITSEGHTNYPERNTYLSKRRVTQLQWSIVLLLTKECDFVFSLRGALNVPQLIDSSESLLLQRKVAPWSRFAAWSTELMLHPLSNSKCFSLISCSLSNALNVDDYIKYIFTHLPLNFYYFETVYAHLIY